ncbi:MAG: ATP-binding protein [Myxococcales bacterium]|nr:ATP-binding protein [Myxococcales bacterium]
MHPEPHAGEPRSLVALRDRAAGRRVARVVAAAGFAVQVVDEPPAIPDDVALVVAEAEDALLVSRWIADRRARCVALCSDDGATLEGLFPLALDRPPLVALLARAGPGQAPRDSELLAVARRALGPPSPPIDRHVAWGAAGFVLRVVDPAQRDAAVAKASELVLHLGATRRVAELAGEVAHELVMNALYDAPTDENGQPRHAHDRRAGIRLSDGDAATLRCACDGAHVAIEAEDRFGRLTRDHLFASLLRGLRGEQDHSGGGAGLGLFIAWRSSSALHFDVEPGARTRVTALLDLDADLRDFRRRPRTIHFP